MPAYDCHVHIYDDTRAVAGSRYQPSAAAPLEGWQRNLAAHGLHGGVVVQPSFLGCENESLLDTLSKLDPLRYRGVAVVPTDVSKASLESLKRGGIAGIRWNLISGAKLPDPGRPEVWRFLNMLEEVGLHLEIQLEASRSQSYLPALIGRSHRLVVDHFGLPESDGDFEWLDRALKVDDERRRLFVKLSAPYRSGRIGTGAGYAARLQELLGPGRLVWGSDWPWTRYEGKHEYADTVAWGRTYEDAGIDFDAGVRELYDLMA